MVHITSWGYNKIWYMAPKCLVLKHQRTGSASLAFSCSTLSPVASSIANLDGPISAVRVPENMLPADSKNLEYGSGMIWSGVSSFFGLGLVHNHITTCWLLLQLGPEMEYKFGEPIVGTVRRRCTKKKRSMLGE